jgi:prepilin-type processing-associated H-X9-DG protein
MALLLPAVQSARESGRRAQCQNNEKQISLALLNYEAARRTGFCGYRNRIASSDPKRPIVASWVPPIFPNIDRMDLYDQWKGSTGIPWDPQNDPQNKKNGFQTVLLRLFICPSDPSDQTGSADTPLAYVVNCGRDNSPLSPQDPRRMCEGIFYDQSPDDPNVPPGPRVTSDYISSHDGTTTTLMLAEGIPPASSWAPGPPARYEAPSPPKPPKRLIDAGITGGADRVDRTLAIDGFRWSTSGNPVPKVANHIASRHGGQIVVSFCDGHQQLLREDIEYPVFQQLMTPNGRDTGVPMPILSDKDYE